MPTPAPELQGFNVIEKRPEVYIVDVLGDVIQEGSNHEWRRLGDSFVKYLEEQGKYAFLVSTCHLEHYLLEDEDAPSPTSSFNHSEKTYFITQIPKSHIEKWIPDIMESEEFVFGLNAWLCLFKEKNKVEDNINKITEEMKNIISNLRSLAVLEVKMEFLAAVSDGIEMLWFKP